MAFTFGFMNLRLNMRNLVNFLMLMFRMVKNVAGMVLNVVVAMIMIFDVIVVIIQGNFCF